MLCKELLITLNDWFGCYIYDKSYAEKADKYIDEHINDSLTAFLSDNSNSIDDLVFRITRRIKQHSERSSIQNVLKASDENAVFGLYYRYALLTEYLENNPDKDIPVNNIEAQFVIDCFINYPRELMKPNPLIV